MAFQPVPTYADPVLVDEKTGKSAFNPVWLSWFLALTAGGQGGLTHNALAGLQGGTSTERYHLSQAEFNNVFIRSLSAPTDISPAGFPPFIYQNPAGHDCDIITTAPGGTIVSIAFSRDGVTYYDCGIISGTTHLSPGDFIKVDFTGVPTIIRVSR